MNLNDAIANISTQGKTFAKYQQECAAMTEKYATATVSEHKKLTGDRDEHWLQSNGELSYDC